MCLFLPVYHELFESRGFVCFKIVLSQLQYSCLLITYKCLGFQRWLNVVACFVYQFVLVGMGNLVGKRLVAMKYHLNARY